MCIIISSSSIISRIIISSGGISSNSRINCSHMQECKEGKYVQNVNFTLFLLHRVNSMIK